MSARTEALATAGFDAVAVKPTERDLRSVADGFDGRVTIDFEGREHLPEPAVLESLGGERDVIVTVPVRADGFDPLGDDRLLGAYAAVGRPAFVAGNGAYLDAHERRRGVAPRLREALARHPEGWVGTEGIERVAMATGATQYELLSATTEREVNAMRTAGFDGAIAVYAPTVITGDDDVALDGLGDYVARRRPVAARLPEGARTDAAASGRARSVLLEAIDDYAIVGPPSAVAERIGALREAGVTTLVGYPAGD